MVVKNSIHTCMGGHLSWKLTTSPSRWSAWKISQRPLHDSRECSSICSSMTWSSRTDQARKCFWRTPSAVSRPEQTPRSSWIYESTPYQPSHSPRDVSPRLQQKCNETHPSSRWCTGSPWTVGPTDKVVSPEQPDSTGVSETSYPSTATSSPRVNESSFHRPAETASSWTSMEAHAGINKAMDLARTCVYWPGMEADVTRLHQTVPDVYREQQPTKLETLHPHEVPPGPWVKIGVDFFQDHLGKKHLIVADYFSKFPYVFPVASSHHFKTISHLRELFAAEGVPAIIMSDNGPPFNSEEFKTIFPWLWLRSYNIVTSLPSVEWFHRVNGQEGQERLQEDGRIPQCSG